LLVFYWQDTWGANCLTGGIYRNRFYLDRLMSQ
jgi:hypothetical protein